MLRLLSDENVPGAIFRGLLRRAQEMALILDLVRAQDEGLSQTPDPQVLEWAAEQGRVVVTYDRSTLVGDARRRISEGKPMPGVIALREGAGIGRTIEHILLVAECYTEEQMRDIAVEYLPFPESR
jgi:hypothetical protein